MQAVRPHGNTGNVQNTAIADVSFDFDQPVTAFSVYYFNYRAAHSSAGTQTIGLRGNEFSVTAVPEPMPMSMVLVLAVGLVIRACWHRTLALNAVLA